MTSNSESIVTLRRAVDDDARFVWEVNNHPSVRAQSISTDAIPWDTHVGWFQRRLVDPATAFFIVCRAGSPVGIVRFEITKNDATIGVALDASARGHGIGALAIALATDELGRLRPGVRAIALIRPDNVASRRAFERAGYVRTGSVEREGVAVDTFEAVRRSEKPTSNVERRSQ